MDVGLTVLTFAHMQLFLKVPALHALAPTQAEPLFVAAQLSVLVMFIALGIASARRFCAALLRKLEVSPS